MNIQNATINDQGIRLKFDNSQSMLINIDQHSGRVVQRMKIDTISNVQHTGIWLGRDKYGTGIILHNHYEMGFAHLSTYSNYSKGEQVYWKDDQCINNWKAVVEIGLSNAINRRPYDVLSYNCQTFTNEACNNKSNSQAVDKWVKIGLIFGISLIATSLFIE